jgi:hypothetical protein
MSHNRYGATLIQDTADFFDLAGPAISSVILSAKFEIESWPAFYSWMFAHQIERVFGLSCEGHKRRSHPNVQFVDQIRNLVDLDHICKASLVVPKIYDDQVLEVSLWYDDLLIRYNPAPAPHPLRFGDMSYRPPLVSVLPRKNSSNI